MIVFLIIFLTVFLLQPLIQQIHARANRVICANNLRTIGKALYIYAKENQREFPPTLKTLYDQEYLADTRLMDCPATRQTGTPEEPDYIYNMGLNINSTSNEVLVQDKFGNHLGDGKTVLYVNGIITWEEE